MGKILDLAERLLPYLEARGDDTYAPGFFGRLNKIIN